VTTELRPRLKRKQGRTLENTRIVAARLDLDTYERIAKAAEAAGSSVASVLEVAVAAWIAEHTREKRKATRKA